MAIDNDYQLESTRNSIIEDASEVAGILDPDGGGLTPIQYTRISRYLNNMIKSWQADGMQVWARKMFGIILEKNVSSYSLNWNQSTASQYCFSGNHLETTFTSGTGTSIVVGSTVGMAANGYIAIEKQDGTYFITTIQTVTNGTDLVLSSGTTDYESGGYVYYYTTLAPRMSRIYAGYLRSPQGFDTPIKILTREEYNLFGVKETPGTTTQVFYDMGWQNGTLRLFPTLNENGYILFLEAMYPFQTFSDSSDIPDFPEEWQNALIYGLAVEIGYRYGADEKRLTKIEQVAKYWRDMALGMSQENSIYIQPTPNWYGKK